MIIIDSIVIGVSTVSSIIVTLLVITICIVACILRGKLKKLNRHYSVGSIENHVYDYISIISQEHAHIMETSVDFGEAMGESRSADGTAPAISQLEGHCHTTQAVTSSEDTNTEAAISPGDTIAIPPMNANTEAAIPPTNVNTEAAIHPMDANTEADIPPMDANTEAAIPQIDTSTEVAIPPMDANTEATISPGDTSTDAVVTEDAAIITSSNKAYGCAIEKVEDHPYTNVDLFEATTLFYTTSDGTRTYRPPQPATGKATVEEEEPITTTFTPSAVDASPAIDASPEPAVDASPEPAVDASHEPAVDASPEPVTPIETSSNPAYGCAIEKVEDRPYTNVDLFEATTLFYTTSDGTRTYRPPQPATHTNTTLKN